MLCLLFSCKKDNPPPPPPPPPPIDSFLLHPPPVLDSLPIPLTIGTWWKYQRNDSSYNYPCYNCVEYNYTNNYTKRDSSIELVTVIGKTTIVDSAQETISPWRKRYDTVESFMLEVKNLTKGTLDTIHAYYYNAQFIIKSNKDFFELFIHVPISEGTHIGKIPNDTNTDSLNVIKNTSVIVLNQIFDNCIYYYDISVPIFGAYMYGNHLTTYLKPGVGFVYWEYYSGSSNHYGFIDDNWYYRRLIDYHIAP